MRLKPFQIVNGKFTLNMEALSIYPMNSARAASFKYMVFVYLFVERQEVWPSLSLHARTAQLDNKYSPEADFPRIAHFTEWQHLF
jgi:hypothetical protein